MWGRGQEGAMALAPLSARFQSLPPVPTIKLGPSGAGSRVGGLVHALGPCGSLQWPLLWGWESLLLLPQPPRAFSVRGLRFYFPALEPWVALSALLPSVPPGLSRCEWGTALPTSRSFATSPPHGLPISAPPTVWVSVSPWLSDFHTVRFSVSSGCFLFLSCCCPSFGCARRRSVSTYAFILAGSPLFLFLRWLFSSTFLPIHWKHIVNYIKLHWMFFFCRKWGDVVVPCSSEYLMQQLWNRTDIRKDPPSPHTSVTNVLRTIPATRIIRLCEGFCRSSELYFRANTEINFMSVLAYYVLFNKNSLKKSHIIIYIYMYFLFIFS